AEKLQSETITAYYTDPDVMDLHKAQQEIQYGNDIEKYKAAFKTLQIDSNPDLIPLWGKVELKSVTSTHGDISMDIHLPDEARLGSGGEMFALDALYNTLFQFKEVKSIDLTVDGKPTESLMGHIELEHPMVRD
ncbi:MAG TPA: GerMN domain-containing protein, partial [Paenibacillus sp.]